MKTKIAALIIVAGSLATGALADNSAATFFPALSNVTSSLLITSQIMSTPRLPDGAELSCLAVVPELAVKPAILSENDLGILFTASPRLSNTTAHQLPPDYGSIPIQTTAPRVVFSMTPAPSSFNEPDRTAYWYPSVTFRFDFSSRRDRRS
jgi:hypothetical protein